MKTYILDALNVIYHSQKFKPLLNRSIENAVSALCSEISEYNRRYPSYKFIIVMDGYLHDINKFSQNIRIVESLNCTADDTIKELIKNFPKKHDLEIVSSDIEVYNFARMNVVKAITSTDFLKLISPQTNSKITNSSQNKKIKSKEKPINASKKEIELLKDLFSNSDDIDKKNLFLK